MSREPRLAALLLFALAACRGEAPARREVKAPEEALVAVAAGRRPALLDQGTPAGLARAVGESLAWLEGQPAERTLAFGSRQVGVGELQAALVDLRALLAGAPPAGLLAAHIKERFDLLESVGSEDGTVLVTGYYEPVIEASLEPREGYGVPIYGPPAELVQAALGEFSESWRGERLVGRLVGQRLVPYWDRREIRRGQRLAGRGLEIAWARDEVDLFFVEVQGSGTLRLPDGSECRVGWAGSNGRTYRSVGKMLIEEGRVERGRMSMQAIRSYLRRHPEQVESVLDYNSSLVFFEMQSSGATGSLGRPVTPGRSIATDRRLFPPAALAFLETTWPESGADGRVVAGGRFGRFVLNQDSGGAIRGPDRVDLFLGRGDRAGAVAGRMQQRGRLYFLAPKPVSPAGTPGTGAR